MTGAVPYTVSRSVWSLATSKLRTHLLFLFDQTLHVCTRVGGAALLRHHFPQPLRTTSFCGVGFVGRYFAPHDVLRARERDREFVAAGLRCLRDGCRRFYRDAITWPRWAARLMSLDVRVCDSLKHMNAAAWAEKRAAALQLSIASIMLSHAHDVLISCAALSVPDLLHASQGQGDFVRGRSACTCNVPGNQEPIIDGVRAERDTSPEGGGGGGHRQRRRKWACKV